MWARLYCSHFHSHCHNTSKNSYSHLPPQQCSRTTPIRETSTTALTITNDDIQKCRQACPDGVVWVSKYKCDGINLTQGCQDNGVVLSWNASAGQSFPVGNLDCGSIQIDAGCKNQNNTYGNVKYLSVQADKPCNTPHPLNHQAKKMRSVLA